MIENNSTLVVEEDFINITIPIYDLIEYSDNYSDTPGSLLKFDKDEIDTNANVFNENSSSFKCKSDLIGNIVADGTNGKRWKSKNSCAVKILN